MKTTAPVEDWIRSTNEQNLGHLERQGRSGPGLVPFLGAGISLPFGFKRWGDLLRDGAPPQKAQVVKSLLARNKYEKAAETLLLALGQDGFQNLVAAAAGDSRLKSIDFSKGTVSLLPLLASGLVITTNFDRVLERAFEANGTPFESVISGPRPDLYVDALHQNRRVLIKLHGDWQDRVGRTFTESDYQANYGTTQPETKRMLLENLEELIFSSRSLLFIGASLESDRTVEILRTVHQRFAGIRHFAIVDAPKNPGEFAKKEKHLTSCGILPLWYQVGGSVQHAGQIEKLVKRIIERISIRTIVPSIVSKPSPPKVASPQVDTPLRESTKLTAHYDRVVRLLEEGRLLFFLGAAIHAPTKLLASHFYLELARLFECEGLGSDYYAIAQYIADRHDRKNLYGEIRKLFARTQLPSRETHELFAAWPKFKTAAGAQLPYPTILTTNYDDVLERRLTAKAIPYHLLSYQADGPDRGLFYHQAPDRTLRIIERPQNIRVFSDAFLIVKLNGGVASLGGIPESYVTTRLDFWDLAARIPKVLPAALQEKLSANPLLFLGHSLNVPDVESLVRFAHRKHSGPRSWAVVLKKTDVKYWQQCGVEIIDRKVASYITNLHRRLTRAGL